MVLSGWEISRITLFSLENNYWTHQMNDTQIGFTTSMSLIYYKCHLNIALVAMLESEIIQWWWNFFELNWDSDY